MNSKLYALFVFCMISALIITSESSFTRSLLALAKSPALSLLSSRYGDQSTDDLWPLYVDFVDDGMKLSRDGKSMLLRSTEKGEITATALFEQKRTPGSTSAAGSRRPRQHGVPYIGFVGVYNLPAGMHALFIRSAEKVPFLAPFNLYKATSFQFVRIPKRHTSSLEMESPMKQYERRQKQAAAEDLLLSTMKKHNFYFSIDRGAEFYDLTLPFQSNFCLRQQRTQEAGNSATSAITAAEATRNADDRFFWNAEAAKGLIDAGGSSFVTRLCSAFVTSFDFELQNTKLQYFLLSRRSKSQQGPRYIKRGANGDGEVANFVETEQIVARRDGSKLSAFRQIRGSIPLHWSQPETWKFHPPIRLDSSESVDVSTARQEMMKTVQRYCYHPYASPTETSLQPSVFVVNLIDKKGGQRVLGSRWLHALFQAFGTRNRALPSTLLNFDRSDLTVMDFVVSTQSGPGKESPKAPLWNTRGRYVWFDYHYQLKERGVSALQDIHRQLLPAMSTSRGGFFSFKKPSPSKDSSNPKKSPHNNKEESMSFQRTIVRSNCVDCLDRTNVMQATIARWVLLQQLGVVLDRFSTTNSKALSLTTSILEQQFRSAWADNGDHLSKLYAGSRAMKRDVTRTGKRTRRGMMDDAVSFAQRYLANNYRDSAYQRALDFFLGLESDSNKLVKFEEDEWSEDDETRNLFLKGSLLDRINGVELPERHPRLKQLEHKNRTLNDAVRVVTSILREDYAETIVGAATVALLLSM